MLYDVIVLESFMIFCVTYDHVTVTCDKCITVYDSHAKSHSKSKNKRNKEKINRVYCLQL